MRISTDIAGFIRYGCVENILSLLKDAGFDAYDFSIYDKSISENYLFSDDYRTKTEQLRKYADSIGIECNQTHAIFPAVRIGDDGYNEWAIQMLARCLEVSSLLGAEICIVHPCNHYTAEQNAEFYLKLLPYAQIYGVKIALENMWNRDQTTGKNLPAACSHPMDFKKHLDLLPQEHYTACVDIGHAYMDGLDTDGATMLKTLGDRVGALHIHDNDFVRDRHMLPYTMNIDFDGVLNALTEIKYAGDITFEAINFTPRFPVALYPEVARLMCGMGRYFREVLKMAERL